MINEKYFLHRFLTECFVVFMDESSAKGNRPIYKISNSVFPILNDLILYEEQSDYEAVLLKLEETTIKENTKEWYVREAQWIEAKYSSSLNDNEIKGTGRKYFIYRFVAHCLMLIIYYAKEGGCEETYLLSYAVRNVPMKLFEAKEQDEFREIAKVIEIDIKNYGQSQLFEDIKSKII